MTISKRQHETGRVGQPQRRPQPCNSGVSQWCTAGLVIAPSASVHTVMPSCDPASSTDSSAALRSAARAARLVAAASSSR